MIEIPWGKAHNQKHLCDPKDEREKNGERGKKIAMEVFVTVNQNK